MDVGLEGVDDPGAVVGGNLNVAVDISGRVDHHASARLFRAHHVAVVREALYLDCFDEHDLTRPYYRLTRNFLAG